MLIKNKELLIRGGLLGSCVSWGEGEVCVSELCCLAVRIAAHTVHYCLDAECEWQIVLTFYV